MHRERFMHFTTGRIAAPVEANSMSDLIFLLLILTSFATTYLLIRGLAKLGKVE